MRTTRIHPAWSGSLALAFLLGLGLIGPVTSPARASRDEGLRYASSYAAAWAEARERNALIFATFHKDN